MATWFAASDKYAAVTAWAASTTYAAGSLRRQLATPTPGNERVFRTAAGGTTGATEPAWVLTKGGSSPTDGTITDWVEVTGSSLYNATNSWLAPHAKIANAASWMAAGDTLYVGNHHASANVAGTGVTITYPGTLAAPNLVISVDDTNATPTYLAGASETNTGGAQSIAGSHISYGLTLLTGGQNTIFGLNQTQVKQVYNNCALGFIGSIANGSILFGSGGGPRYFECNNTTFRFGASSQGIGVTGHLRINGGGLTSDSVNAAMFVTLGPGVDVIVDGFDFSTMAVGFIILKAGSTQVGNLRLQNCKSPSAWTGGFAALPLTAIARGEMFAVANDDTMYAEQVVDYSGSVQQETATFTRAGGAAIPNTKAGGTDPIPFAWKFAPSASASYPFLPLKSSSIVIDSLIAGTSSVGSLMTLTAHVLVDSVTEPNDNDIFMEVKQPGTAGVTLSAGASSAPSGPLTAPQSLTSKYGGAGSGWTTTGMTNPKMRKIVVTFTPQEKGMVFATLCVANAAMTVYADPLIVVS